MIKLNPEAINAPDSVRATPIEHAFSGHSWKMAALLLKNGANPDGKIATYNFQDLLTKRLEINTQQLTILLAAGLKPTTMPARSDKTLAQHFTQPDGDLFAHKPVWDEAIKTLGSLTSINTEAYVDGLVPSNLLSSPPKSADESLVLTKDEILALKERESRLKATELPLTARELITQHLLVTTSHKETQDFVTRATGKTQPERETMVGGKWGAMREEEKAASAEIRR